MKIKNSQIPPSSSTAHFNCLFPWKAMFTYCTCQAVPGMIPLVLQPISFRLLPKILLNESSNPKLHVSFDEFEARITHCVIFEKNCDKRIHHIKTSKKLDLWITHCISSNMDPSFLTIQMVYYFGYSRCFRSFLHVIIEEIS